MSCTIIYYILLLCLHVLSMDLKDLKQNIFIFKLYTYAKYLEFSIGVSSICNRYYYYC